MAHASIGARGGRSELVIVRSTGASATKLYLASDALPADVHDVRVCLVARNQGFCDDPDQGSWSWFEVSLIRPRSASTSEQDIDPSLYTAQLEHPQTFAGDLAQKGWDLVALGQGHLDNSTRLLILPISETWQKHEITFRDHDNLHSILSHASECDRVLIWARSQYSGWTTSVQEARIEMRTKDSKDVPYAIFDPLPLDRIHQSTDAFDRDAIKPFYVGSPTLAAAPRSTGSRSCVLQHLNVLHAGAWQLCDHDCKSTDHGHENTLCPVVEKITPDRQSSSFRGVFNQCVHYWKPPTLEGLFRTLLVCRTNPSELLEVILLSDNCELLPESCVALSYCWGDLRETKSIMLNHVLRMPDQDTGMPGICFRHSYNVTVNLYGALCRLRDGYQLLPFWIDALCINQNDLDERNYQVSRMGEIYGNARAVWIWLNETEEVRRSVYPKMTMMRKILEEAYKEKFDPYQFNFEYANLLDRLSFSEGRVEFVKDGQVQISQHVDLEMFFELPWFRRVWVLQEVFRANANAFVLTTSGLGLPFTDVLTGLCYLWLRPSYLRAPNVLNRAPYLWYTLCVRMPARGGRNQTGRMLGREEGSAVSISPANTDRSGSSNSERMSMLLLFQQAADFQASDPKDKLYALLGLAKEFLPGTALPDLVQPEYRKSDSQVYVDFTRFCILQSCKLDVLSVTVMSASAKLSVHPTPRIPSDYVFPPHNHPTWSLWHAHKELWMQLIGAEIPWYNNLSCVDGSLLFARKSTEMWFSNASRITKVDTGLLSTFGQSNESTRLPLRGIELDTVLMVFPFCLRDPRQNLAFIGDATKTTLGTIHMLWDMIFIGVKAHLANPSAETSQVSQEYANLDANGQAHLFDEFLLTMFCDKPLYQIRDLNDSDSYLEASRDKDLMHEFLHYWLSTYPDLTSQKCAHRRFYFDASLPPLQTTNLPQVVLDAWQDMIPELTECDKDCRIMHKEYAAEMLHHTAGNWLFMSKSGRLGLCPYGTKVGDKLVALWGAKHASVLRADSSGSDIAGSVEGKGWMFVGEAMVHRWLGGQYIKELLEHRKVKEKVWVLV